MPWLLLFRVISWIVCLSLFRLGAFQHLLEVLHRTDNISLAFFEEGQCADGRNLKLGHYDLSTAPFMINYRVENLDRLLEQLRAEGAEVDDRIEEYEYGRFAWIMDLEGNRIELWEPLVPFATEHS